MFTLTLYSSYLEVEISVCAWMEADIEVNVELKMDLFTLTAFLRFYRHPDGKMALIHKKLRHGTITVRNSEFVF